MAKKTKRPVPQHIVPKINLAAELDTDRDESGKLSPAAAEAISSDDLPGGESESKQSEAGEKPESEAA